MFFSESDIRQVTETVWSLVLRIQPQEGPPTPVPREGSQVVSGSVRVEGSWNGKITLSCDMPLAQHAAELMYDQSAETLPESDVYDAVGELANMIGGNVRALLPEPCQLSLPTVHGGAAIVGQGGKPERTLFELSFTSEGQAFWVSLSTFDS